MAIKLNLKKIYKKRIKFNSSPLVWLFWIFIGLAVTLVTVGVAFKENINNTVEIVLIVIAVLFFFSFLLMIYYVCREEIQRIKQKKKPVLIEFETAEHNMKSAEEYLLNKKYRCIKQKKTKSTYKSWTSLAGNKVLIISNDENRITIERYIENSERLKKRHGLYGILLYPAKIKFRKHIAVILELLEAPEEIKI